MKVYIDQGVNQRKLRELRKKFKFEVVQGHRTEGRIKGASQVSEPFTIGVSVIGGMDKIVGDNMSEVSRIIGKNNRNDISHIYSAYMENGCEYFITNNADDFIRNGKNDAKGTKRKELEKQLQGLRVVTLNEFERALAKRSSAASAR